ncbi:hypothetical protein M1349_02520 [Patescibacteria group bacterium]|nr:hypothetical protein [Patescibacteria group bacterium]
MNSNINLILSKEGQTLKNKKKIKLLNSIALGLLLSVAAASVVLFLLNTLNPLSSIKKDQLATINNITVLKERSGKLVIVNDRLKNILEINNKRKKFSPTIDYLISILGNLKISFLEVDDKSISFSVSSYSLLEQNDFLQKLIVKSSKKEMVQDLIIDSLTVNEKTGLYQLKLRATVL